MLEGKQLGPFRIDRMLGSGAMGSVYLGIYPKNGKKVAVKVMAAGLVESESALRRFEREASILTQLNHPNIVRIFGTGKKHDVRFYAMEYLQGESLDHVMARRGRMTWEEVVDIAQQLCAALEHAHEKGVIHRDLKPSNLIVMPNGTLKLTDFGIAKDLDVTQLTEANCTVGTAAYMSPEQCRGERNLTYKSDLYSLGILLYELICGRKPFTADNAMEMFLLHVQGPFERPSRLVLDLPVWLDNLICQLMEKKPEHRPLNAARVKESLTEIREKVEAMQSAGVTVAQARRIDRARGKQPAMDEADKEAARQLTGRRKRKKKGEPIYRSAWFVGLAVAGLLTFMGALIYVLTLPPSAASLYAAAAKLMQSNKPEDWEKARDGPIATYRKYYRMIPGEQTEQMESWGGFMVRYEKEELLRRYVKKSERARKIMSEGDNVTEPEKLAFLAAEAEEDGNRDLAAERWTKMSKTYTAASDYPEWGEVARDHLKTLRNIDADEASFRKEYQESMAEGSNPRIPPDDSAREIFTALRYGWFGDRFMAGKFAEELHEKWKDQPEQRKWYLFARWEEREMAHELKTPPTEKQRQDMLNDKLAEAKKAKPSLSRGICLTILALYSKEQAMESACDEARKLLNGK